MISTASHTSPAATRYPAFAAPAVHETPRATIARRDSPSTAFALLYLDVDSIKRVHAAHGPDMSDELLRAVTMRLERSIRANDGVNYLGGDTFVCLIGGWLDHDQLSHLACKLFDAVSATFKIGLESVTLQPSIGIVMCPADAGSTGALLKNANAAMTRAKRLQSGYAFCHEAGGITIG